MAVKPSIASIAEQIENEGSGDWTEHDRWESEWWAKKLPAEKRVAAKLVAAGVEEQRIDNMLKFPSGQIETWWANSEEFQRACRAAYWERRERSVTPDPTKGLTPKQLRAAEAYFVDAGSQKEVAAAIGVSDRTIRNWLQDPVFVFFGEQLRKERSDELARDREEQQRRTRTRYLAQVEKAQDIIDEKLDEKDPKVVLAIARSYMRSAP
jgi:transposase